MRTMLLFFTAFVSSGVMAQSDSLKAAVYNWSNVKAQTDGARESRQVLKGSTLDLSNLQVHTSTLPPGQANHPPKAYDDAEELVIVKEGNLTITINDTARNVGTGGIALVEAGDRQSFQNVSGKPVTYYVLRFQSKNPVNIQRGKQGGGSFIKDWNELETKKTDKGESRPVFDRPSSMFERFDVHATSLDPGFASHPPHTHRAEEIILLMKGDVQMQIGQAFYKAVAGDVIFLASTVPHALKNTGNVQCSYFAIQWHNKLKD